MKKLDLVLRNTQEVIKRDELEKLLRSKRKPVMYIGAAPTGKVHVGYLLLISKIKDFIDAGFEVKFLLANIHAYLDDRKSPWDLTLARSKYYKEAISAMLKSAGADSRKVKFVLGSNFQMKKDYILDLYKMMGMVNLTRAKRASSEVVRQVDNPDLGSFNYALMQAIDVHHIGADVAFSGIDQRKIYMLAREEVSKLGHKKPICVFTPVIPGLFKGKKMSASDAGSAITFEDTPKEVKKKMNKAYCPEGVVENNGVLAMAKHVIFPIRGSFTIVRPAHYGGTVEYTSYEQLEKEYKSKKIHPADLKSGVADELNKFISVVQKHFKNKQSVIKKAYPK